MEGRTLNGCMWLADIKYEWSGQTLAPPIPIEAGTRYAIWHCCCDYSTLSPAENKVLRDQWKSEMVTFREKWSRKFGEWPLEKNKHWPGHHIRDLAHGGHPTDTSNIVPVPPAIHDVFNKQYPACYAGSVPWNTIGPNLPYRDR